MLLILDTNLIINAFTSKKSVSLEILKLFRDEKLKLATCLDTIKELKDTIKKPGIKEYPNFDQKTLSKFIPLYQHKTIKYELPKRNPTKTCRDPKDNMFLLLAEVSQANFLLTLDEDLLELSTIGTTKICLPANFLKYLNPKI